MRHNIFKDKTINEIIVEKDKLTKEYKDLKFKKVTGVIENPLKLRTIRKNIARINTIVHMSELDKIKKEIIKTME